MLFRSLSVAHSISGQLWVDRSLGGNNQPLSPEPRSPVSHPQLDAGLPPRGQLPLQEPTMPLYGAGHAPRAGPASHPDLSLALGVGLQAGTWHHPSRQGGVITPPKETLIV